MMVAPHAQAEAGHASVARRVRERDAGEQDDATASVIVIQEIFIWSSHLRLGLAVAQSRIDHPNHAVLGLRTMRR
jgi:hypothetical protein